MMNFLKNKEDVKSVKETVDKIHESFYTEVDRLLAEAKVANSLKTDKQHLVDKSKRLRKLGFASSREVQKAEEEIERLKKLKEDNKRKEALIRAINYFSSKYPHYKFITEESVKRICEKYGLVFGSVDRYIGTVPDKNLKQIEDFKIMEHDKAYMYFNYLFQGDQDILSLEECKRRHDQNSRLEFSRQYGSYNKMQLRIVAPLKDFNMDKHEIVDYKISKVEVPDPVVLQPVLFESSLYYLIVTAWGPEAGDERIVNENHN